MATHAIEIVPAADTAAAAGVVLHTEREADVAPEVPAINVCELLAEMELRKMHRRWRGHLEFSTLGAPLLTIVLIYALPLFFELGLTDTSVCRGPFGQVTPCHFDDHCVWSPLPDGNGSFSYTCNGVASNSTVSFISMPRLSLFCLFGEFAFVVVLLVLGEGLNSWIYKYYLYGVASFNAIVRISLAICYNVDGCMGEPERERLQEVHFTEYSEFGQSYEVGSIGFIINVILLIVTSSIRR